MSYIDAIVKEPGAPFNTGSGNFPELQIRCSQHQMIKRMNQSCCKVEPCPKHSNPAAPSVFPATRLAMAPVRQPRCLPLPLPSAGTWDADANGTWKHE